MNGGRYSGRYDAIVIGAGVMGSATAYYLARRGKRVLGLERFGIPHNMGSSRGHTRIIRLAYYEHPSYVLLLQRAYELWRETMDRGVHEHDEQLLREFAERYFPDGCGPTMDLQTCMFTNTEDNHFVIDLHPDHEQVSFASPCSGHGFKFASVVGEILADLAEKGITRHDISLFRLDRLLRTTERPSAHPAGAADREAHGQNGRHRSFPRVSDVKPFW